MPDSQDPTFNQLETLDPQSLAVNEDRSTFPCLTIVYHPQLARVGEQAIIGSLMGYATVELSRRTPEFSHPGSAGLRPLRDPFLSRRPIKLERIDADFLSIEPTEGVHLQLNGDKVETFVDIPIEDLYAGVFLTLSKRVILLLHFVTLEERAPYERIVGESHGIRLVRQQIAQVADLEVPVLIRGETGVGKELVAKCIHRESSRVDAPYHIINMATVQEGTASSILFGHAKGAFTGARTRRAGLFEEADGGTLFMDEIGDTPAQIQSMLLRALSEGTILPMGEVKEISVDVRIIAATDVNIEDSGQQGGNFRAALLHRLSGYEIRVPPLRERREDIPRLVVHFLAKVLEEVKETERLCPPETERRLWFPPSLMLKLCAHDWPGNVRHLYNAVRQLVISNRGMDMLRVGVNTKRILEQRQDASSTEATGTRGQTNATTNATAAATTTTTARRQRISDDELYEALEACNWQIGPAAERLGMPRSTLYGRIERHPRIRKAADLTRSELADALHKSRGDIDKLVQRLKVSPRGLRLRLRALNIDPAEYQS